MVDVRLPLVVGRNPDDDCSPTAVVCFLPQESCAAYRLHKTKNKTTTPVIIIFLILRAYPSIPARRSRWFSHRVLRPPLPRPLSLSLPLPFPLPSPTPRLLDPRLLPFAAAAPVAAWVPSNGAVIAVAVAAAAVRGAGTVAKR